MPVLMNCRMNAWSLTDSTADGISGTAKGFVRTIGDSFISLAQADTQVKLLVNPIGGEEPRDAACRSIKCWQAPKGVDGRDGGTDG